MKVGRVELSGSVSPTKVHSRVRCGRLRHSSHRVPVRATPEKQMEYREGGNFRPLVVPRDESLPPKCCAVCYPGDSTKVLDGPENEDEVGKQLRDRVWVHRGQDANVCCETLDPRRNVRDCPSATCRALPHSGISSWLFCSKG